jgi:hypothetical protein
VLAAIIIVAAATSRTTAQFIPGGGGPLAPASITSVPTTGYVPPAYGGYYPPGLPYGSYYDPFGGYFRGVADLTQAYGQYYKDVNQARIINQQVEQEKIRTRIQLLELRRYEQSLLPTVEDLREKKRQTELRRALNDPPLPDILSADALNSLLANVQDLKKRGANGPTVPLDDEMLKQIHVTGGGPGNIAVFRSGSKVNWPFALRDTPYDEDRKKFQATLDEAFQQLQDNDLRPATVRELTAALRRLEATLERNSGDLDLAQILETRRFLEELRDGVAALRGPNVANYFNKKWSAQGRDVRELVEHMSSQGLRFAPAVRGNEAAYRFLHQALVSYNYGASAQVRR